jgi:competence protein ComEC
MLITQVSSQRNNSTLTVAFLDVGQGDAVFIESPSGRQVLYDAGPGGKVIEELSRVMTFFDRSLDLLILSHPDQDHVAGFSDVLRRYEVGNILDSGYKGEVGNAFYQDILFTAKEKKIPVHSGKSGEHIDLGNGASLDILAPEGAYMVGDTNIASIVTILRYGSTSLLLSGDLPLEFEHVLVQKYGSVLDVDVFKAGHHGSRTSSSEEFLRAMTPGLVVVSSGKGNTYGHPHKEVIDRFNRLHIPWMNTADKGAIVLTSDGTKWNVVDK